MYVCEDGLDQNGLDTRRNRALTNYCSTFCRFRRFFPSFWILIPFHSQFITNNNEKMRNCGFLEFIGLIYFSL